MKKNVKPVYEPFSGNPNADKFHRIEPEHIAGYVVLSEVHYPGGGTGWAQHTYLAIMMDDLDTFEHWVPESFTSSSMDFVSLPRADVMADALGAQAGIAEGYAILMLGPRVEFYEYKAKPEWEERDRGYYLGPDLEDGEYVADRDAALETSCFSKLGGGGTEREKSDGKRGDLGDRSWAVDVREGSASQALGAVDSLFKSVVGRDVLYRGDTRCLGRKSRSWTETLREVRLRLPRLGLAGAIKRQWRCSHENGRTCISSVIAGPR